MVTLYVSNLDCSHNAKTISNALKEKDIDNIISLDDKTVVIVRSADAEVAMATLSNAGFNPTL